MGALRYCVPIESARGSPPFHAKSAGGWEEGLQGAGIIGAQLKSREKRDGFIDDVGTPCLLP